MTSFPDDIPDTGAIHLIYGSSNGLASADNAEIHPDVDGVESAPASGAQFGWSLAIGNFDGDGFADLAVGVPGQSVGFFPAPTPDAGVVHVFFGSSTGPDFSRDLRFSQGTAPDDGAEDDDRFGRNLTVGDFDGDGRDDLVVATELEDEGALTSTGVVHVYYGTPTSFPERAETWKQDAPGLPAAIDQNDKFGQAVAAGNFDGASNDDLAIGSPGETLDPAESQHGAVYVLYSGCLLFCDGFESGDTDSWSVTIP